jgi:hypothetical protein
MRITFTETRRLSQDGFKVEKFEAGTTHDVGRSAACFDIRNGWARPEMETAEYWESVRLDAIADHLLREMERGSVAPPNSHMEQLLSQPRRGDRRQEGSESQRATDEGSG